MYQIISAVAGGILGGFEALTKNKAINKAAVANYKAAIKSISTNYNYGVLANTTAIKSEIAQARRTLENFRYNSKQKHSTIRASIAETGTEGSRLLIGFGFLNFGGIQPEDRQEGGDGIHSENQFPVAK